MNEIHTQAMQLEFDWLSKAIEKRMQTYLANGACEIPAPPKLSQGSVYSEIAPVESNGRTILSLALARLISPATLDPFLMVNPVLERPFTEFGGFLQNSESGFVPTLQTALFLLTGNDLAERAKVYKELFSDTGVFARQLVRLEGPADQSPQSRKLVVPMELATHLLTGEAPQPIFSTDFPATRLQTELTWNDLILSTNTMQEIDHIRGWMKLKPTMLDNWGLSGIMSPGYRALFYGPSGTGKTLTAALLGKELEQPVYRIDLSTVVTKYIGETEKNLTHVFDNADRHNWILFFDEADALFGKRALSTSSNDRHANQKVSYLLQRIETFSGLTILATNLPGSIDVAFTRRFQSTIEFPQPGRDERFRLWSAVINRGVPLNKDVSLQKISSNYELTGSQIVNVIRYASVLALSAGNSTVAMTDLETAIAIEQRKEATDG